MSEEAALFVALTILISQELKHAVRTLRFAWIHAPTARWLVFCTCPCHEYYLQLKGKSVSLQAWSSPEGSRKLRFPDFMTTVQEGGNFSALPTGCIYPQEISWYSFLLEAESTPRTIVRSEGLCQWKIPMTPSGIEPATFRFVAQHLNHCASAVTQLNLHRKTKLVSCSEEFI